MKLDVIHVPDVHDSFTGRASRRDRNDQEAETTNARPSIFPPTSAALDFRLHAIKLNDQVEDG